MYVWKLWRDSRARLLSCAVLGVVWVAAGLYWQISYLPKGVVHNWAFLAPSVHTPLVVLSLLTAMLLSEVLIGAEFAKHTAELLLTRPRRRRYFAWTGWLVAILQILAILYLMVGCGALVLSHLTGSIVSWRLLAMPVLLLPSAALLFGLGYLLSSISNGRQGAILTFGALIAYYGSVTLITQHWHIDYPPRWWFDNLSSWATVVSPGTFPALPLLGWVLLALLFPLVAQWSLERKQI